MSDYDKLLKTPEWHARRAEIMQRDGNKCVYCQGESGDPKLNVHHRFYFRGRMPWDYPDQMLLTLCETCHWNHHGDIDQLLAIASFLRPETLPRLLGHARRLLGDDTEIQPTADPDGDQGAYMAQVRLLVGPKYVIDELIARKASGAKVQ